MRIPECESTNIEARRLITEGGAAERPGDFLWVSARRQTGGRGRQGRTWVGAEGNLFLSVVARVARADRLTWLGLAVGLAVARWVREHTGVEARVKWPNDLVVGGGGGAGAAAPRKLAGMLCESVSAPGAPPAATVIVGIGMNCASAPEVPDRAVTSLTQESGRAWDAADLDESIARCVWDAARALDAPDGVDQVRARWEEWSALPRGSLVVWGDASGGAQYASHEGEVLGLGEYGELRVMTAAGEQALLAEDVHLRRPQ